MIKIFLPILIVLLLMNMAICQNTTVGTMEQIGTSMANFLKIGIGAREVAMGGAAVADCDNVSALFWNPGALDRMPQNEVLVQQTQWLVNSQIYFLGAGFKISGLGAIGLSLEYFDSGEMEETTLTFPEGTGRTFNAYDMAMGLTFSREIIERFSAGITVKYIQEGLDLEKASTIAIDIGSVFETDFLNNLKIGMSLSNLGGMMKLSGSGLQVQYSPNPGYPTKITTADLSTEEWDIPLYFRLGIATDVLNSETMNWKVVAEVMDSRDYIYRFSLGTEIGFYDRYYLRGGYKFMYDEENFTMGAGVNLNFSWAQIRLDYAYASFGVFDNTQRFSLIFAY
jgi:hypothetical protein